MQKAVVLLSGGLDSTVTLAKARSMGYDIYPLHINYKQLTMKRELKAFTDVCNYYNIGEDKRLIVDISYLADIGGSALIDRNIKLEEGSIPKSTAVVPNSYVYFRNGNMISIAVSFAERLNATKIFIGAVEEDSSGYPDCRNIFFEKFNELLTVGLANDRRIEILTPIIELDKPDIVKLGIKLDAPLDLTWSCYQSEDEACGVCESCFLRLRGFRLTGYVDEIKYKNR